MSEHPPSATGSADDGHEHRGAPRASVDSAVLAAAARLLSLRETGLGADSDARMEFYAQWVRDSLSVPVALVTLVQSDEQVFPGMCGLPEPWASKRSTPLSHSFCKHVVAGGEPLVIDDAREHPLVRDNLAIGDLGVVAYAGIPLSDDAGNVLGSLCAIDTEPRTWTVAQIEQLARVASACETELRLRLARVDANRERARRDESEAGLRQASERGQALLLASVGFAETTTMQDVRARVSELTGIELGPTYVGLSLFDRFGRLQRVRRPGAVPGAEDARPWGEYDLDTTLPSATAVREGRIVVHPDRDSYDAAYPQPARDLLRAMGLFACVAVPLPGTDGPIGVLSLGWHHPRTLSMPDLVTLTTIAGFAAQAVARARHLQRRESVARRMQQAMLTHLPDTPALPMAAGYHPADSREDVGGDWYDVTPLSDAATPGEVVAAVSVGDIVGHTLAAALIMGQVRSMLRQAAWDHPGGPPSVIFGAFEDASRGTGLNAAGSAVLVHLRRRADSSWSMSWTNAGHPPPVLVHPDGSVELLEEHDSIFGMAGLPFRPRRDHRREIAPGSTLFLYTDGLVERRDRDIDAGIERLVAHLAERRHLPVHELVDSALDALGADDDDVVAFAIRFPEPGEQPVTSHEDRATHVPSPDG